MITYHTMNDDAPTVSKHGSTFNEAEERQKQYPFQLCPECISENTEVVKQLRSDYRLGTHTGSKYRIRKGIFNHQYDRVNYICKDCGCEFYQLYRTGVKESLDVDDGVAGVIIGLIGFVLSLFILITFLSIDNPPVWMIVMDFLFGISISIFGGVIVWALGKIFG